MQSFENSQFEIKDIWQSEKSRLFRTEIKIYNNEFSGMLAVKKTDTAKFRIIFINEVGMKFFDFEITETTDSVLFIFEPMNKKLFIKMLIEDYRSLLFIPKEKRENLHKTKDRKIVLHNKKNKMYFLFSEETGYPYAIYKKGLIRKKFNLNFQNYKNNFPQSIIIKHNNIKFTNSLTLIK